MMNLARAIEIAEHAHKGQTDLAGKPYITHPFRVMEMVDTEEEKIAAVLHDVVEDTSVTLNELANSQFPARSLHAIDLLTHKKDVLYHEYVFRIASDDIATAVKIADLKDNTRIDRAIMRPKKIQADARRMVKYILSYKYLTKQIEYENYKTAMEANV
jgi:(p)ppGpp synthase/HD superfamily hydrolase